MKRLAVLVVTLIILASLLGGCQTASPTAAPTAAPTTAPSSAPTTAAATTEATAAPTAAAGENINGLVLPISTTGESFTLMCTDLGIPDIDMNTTYLPVFAELTKRTGVTIKFTTTSSDNYGTVLLPLLASGQNLPDTFIMGGADLVQMGKDGTIIDLKDLIAKDCPNTNILLEKYPLAKYSITAPEGQIWGYPNRIGPFDDKFQGLDLGYRLDWIKKLKLSEPQTLDDWHTMLTAFLTQDPNGNGKADEVPFMASNKNQLYDFALAYGMSPWSGWFSSKTGTVAFDWSSDSTTANARAYVTLMAQWFKEKLIDQNMLVEHGDAANAMLVGDQAGAAVTWTGSFSGWTAQMKSKYPNAEWMVSMPPKGPVDQAYENYPYVNGERWMISKTCKNPDTILKVFDYLFGTDEGQILNNFGIEGTSYTMVDGKPQYVKSFIVEDHYKDPSLAIAAIGCGKVTNFVREDSETQTYALSYSADLMQRASDVNKYVRVMFPFVTATSAESDSLKKMADINTTVDEYFSKFVTNSLEINDANWNEFVSKLKTEGIDDMVKIKQTQYDRYYQTGK